MSNFDVAFEYIIRNEGELSNNTNDLGGITKYGISSHLISLTDYWLGAKTIEDYITNLTLEEAKQIYLKEFWEKALFEKISNQEHCNYIFDMAINMGFKAAFKCAQRACWAVFKKRSIKDDGILGEETLAALKTCGFLLMPAMRSERAGYYRSLNQPEFINGWLNRAYESN
jgi:lysozyme family protein